MGNRRHVLALLASTVLAGMFGNKRSDAGRTMQSMGAGRIKPATDAPGLITLFLCGDLMTGRGIDQILPHSCHPQLYEPYVRDARDYVRMAERANGRISKPVPYAYVWGNALAELETAAPDVRIINLETAITEHDQPWPKGINYRMHPRNIPVLTAARIDCCVLANNHVLDWGMPGLTETLATLSGAGISHAGAGHDLRAAQAPAILAVPGKGRVLVFAFGSESSGIARAWAATPTRPGVNLLLDLSTKAQNAIAAQVGEVKRPGDIALASIHWGGNWGHEIQDAQRAFAHALIDSAQIDLVHGHSSHHPKGIEVYRERPIIYGCGDLLNDYEGIRGHGQYRGELGLMYLPSFDPHSGRLARFVLVPTRIRNLRIQHAAAAEVDWLVGVLNREGRALGTGVTLDGQRRLELQWESR
jgi:poly-gamma-glutamate synthesis protein (capsule biosynthesis protein)